MAKVYPWGAKEEELFNTRFTRGKFDQEPEVAPLELVKPEEDVDDTAEDETVNDDIDDPKKKKKSRISKR